MKKLINTALVASVLFASTSALASTVGVKVECYGNCSNIYLEEICSSVGRTTVDSVACDDTADASSSVTCGSGRCQSIWYSDRGAKLGDFCKDGNGYDAVVSCS